MVGLTSPAHRHPVATITAADPLFGGETGDDHDD
jgi:hypothetical protein